MYVNTGAKNREQPRSTLVDRLQMRQTTPETQCSSMTLESAKYGCFVSYEAKVDLLG